MADGTPVTLYGRILLQTTIEVVTGLHVGAVTSSYGVSGIDLPIVRDPISGRPYLPGSSLRGKMRAQMEKLLGLPLNWPARAPVQFHVPQTKDEYEASPIGRVFGVPGTRSYSIDAPTRLVVRDAFLSTTSQQALERARTDLPYSELKAEVSIDRVTAEALPRQIERLPAGAQLGPAELVFSVYQAGDAADFGWVVRGLRLVEDDYLGGHGSRGSGKVRFRDFRLVLRTRSIYRAESNEAAPERRYNDLDEILADLTGLEQWLRSSFALPA